MVQRHGRAVVPQQRQQLRPRVVADRIHHPLALDDQRHVEIGDKDALARGQRRHDVVAFRRDDRGHAAAANAAPGALVGRDFRDLLLGQPAGGVDDEAAAFQRVVADRHLDLVGEDLPDQRAGKLGDVDLLVLRHQRVAGERVVVLPAGQRADAPHRSVHHLQPGAVALAPDHPLMEGRRDLAALQPQRAVGVEDQLRVVERAMVALVDAEHDDEVVPAGGRRHRLRHRAGHHHGVVVEMDVLGAAQHRRADEREIRIPGHEGLGEDHQPRALAGRLRGRGEHALERARRRVEVRRDLHRGHPDQFLVRHLKPPSPRRPIAASCAGRGGRTGAAGPRVPSRLACQSVQVSRMKAPSRRCSRIRSITSSGLIGVIPGINDGSPWPYSACSANRQA